jgi:alkyl hydroperoxide reductase subunit AhpC
LSEVTSFSEHFEEFSKLNCQVLAISTDSKYTHLAWTSTGPGRNEKLGVKSLKIPLLADHSQTVSRHYGILEAGGNAKRYVF